MRETPELEHVFRISSEVYFTAPLLYFSHFSIEPTSSQAMTEVNRLQSRAWSCSELMRGSAAVVDQSPAGAAIKQETDLLAETANMSEEQLQAMLED